MVFLKRSVDLIFLYQKKMNLISKPSNFIIDKTSFE